MCCQVRRSPRVQLELVLMCLAGEAVIITRDDDGDNTRVHRQRIVPMRSYTPDIFEYVYFARPDSTLDGISVHDVRKKMGHALADAMSVEIDIEDVDVIIPVPETSYVGALAAAQLLRKPFSFGLVKNRYIGRTFIMPGAEHRSRSVQRKLSAVEAEFRGKHVCLIDDSIVRGTTSKAIIQMARAAGARKVTFGSCAPAIR